MHQTTQLCDILIVEDDESIRWSLAELLTDEGYQVATAEHGKAALDYLQQTETLPRLILLDVMMPIMSGFEFRAMQKLHPEWQGIPVVVMSAIASRMDMSQRVELDAVALVEKPVEWSQLEQVIDRWCQP